MGKIGKISTIKREFSSSLQTMQSELAKKGMTRIPGTGVFKYPYKEFDNKYRTGLDPEAGYIKRIEDPTERELEVERVIALKKRLQASLGDVDLGPRSPFWNHALSISADDQNHVHPAKLLDGDNLFDLSVPFQELTFSWLRVHPTVARSYKAWKDGEYPADTMFYVVDEEAESLILYKQKAIVNKAITQLDGMGPEKKRKVARMLGLPVTDDTREETVYNLIDNVLKQSEFKSGKYQGLSPIEVFSRFATMADGLLHIKDLVKQAIIHGIYRVRPDGHVYEGEYEVAREEEDLVKFLANDDNQEDLLVLEAKLKTKKLATT